MLKINNKDIRTASKIELVAEIVNGFQQLTQPVITCSKLTIETLEQGVKDVQS